MTTLRWTVALLLLAVPARTQDPFGLLPAAPNTEERWVPIEALKKLGPSLAESFAAHVYRNARGESMPYRLFTPAPLETGRRYPLVVFLHGSGGSGTDNVAQLQRANMFGSLVWTLPENQKKHPAFVLAPQSDVNWACVIIDPENQPRSLRELRFCPSGVLGPGARLAFEIIDNLMKTLPIDRSRIYVTGHSMGGAGTWHMVAHRPGFFAAAVPVCGHPDPASAQAVKDVPIWNFHGQVDDIEPVKTSRVMIEALRRAGGHPRHTEYPDVAHNVFMWAYTEPGLIAWLYAQKLPTPR